jgi:ABC-type antimicrobial peptide transport system permease subunit
MLQFLIEAAVLSLVGGLLGIGFGLGAAKILAVKFAFS